MRFLSLLSSAFKTFFSNSSALTKFNSNGLSSSELFFEKYYERITYYILSFSPPITKHFPMPLILQRSDLSVPSMGATGGNGDAVKDFRLFSMSIETLGEWRGDDVLGRLARRRG